MNNSTEMVKATSFELRTCKNIVYMIVNNVNKKAYIGITSQTFKKRYNNDFSNHHNIHFQNAIKKYGSKNFDIFLLEKEVESYDRLKELETKYIKKYRTLDKKCGYNQTLGGDGTLGRKISDVTREKMSKKAKGKIRSKEHCENLSKSKMGINSLSVMTEEQLKERSRKLSIATSGKNNPMYNRKDKMNPEEYEQWKKNCSRPGKNNGSAKATIVIYKNNKYTFDYGKEALNYFKGKGEHICIHWFYNGVPEKHRDTFQFVGYEENFKHYSS